MRSSHRLLDPSHGLPACLPREKNRAKPARNDDPDPTIATFLPPFVKVNRCVPMSDVTALRNTSHGKPHDIDDDDDDDELRRTDLWEAENAIGSPGSFDSPGSRGIRGSSETRRNGNSPAINRRVFCGRPGRERERERGGGGGTGPSPFIRRCHRRIISAAARRVPHETEYVARMRDKRTAKRFGKKKKKGKKISTTPLPRG